jgi:L-ascorbate metabolism protein UlaG (beta-lactamase superfamily)
MKITKYGHSAFLIEEGEARILLDPGSYSSGFEKLTDLSAIIYTHQHGDHLDRGKLKLLASRNPRAVILADIDSSRLIKIDGFNVQPFRAGDKASIAGVEIEAIGAEHAVIHPDIPIVSNIGYMIASRFFYPGDALTLPVRTVEILALPIVAPWSKVEEVVDYARNVKPKVVIPAHDAIIATTEMYYGMITSLTDNYGIKFEPLANGSTIEL